MSHQPPVPAANQSPYPLQEPPHAAAGTSAPAATSPAATSERAFDTTPAVIGALATIGAVAVAAVGYWAFGAFGRKQPAKRGRRRAKR